MADPREMNAQLMRASRQRLQCEQRVAAVPSQSTKARHAVVTFVVASAQMPARSMSGDALARRRHAVAALASFRQRQIDDAGRPREVDIAQHARDVELAHVALGERLRQLRLPLARKRDQQHAAGAFVDAMDRERLEPCAASSSRKVSHRHGAPLRSLSSEMPLGLLIASRSGDRYRTSSIARPRACQRPNDSVKRMLRRSRPTLHDVECAVADHPFQTMIAVFALEQPGLQRLPHRGHAGAGALHRHRGGFRRHLAHAVARVRARQPICERTNPPSVRDRTSLHRSGTEPRTGRPSRMRRR